MICFFASDKGESHESLPDVGWSRDKILNTLGAWKQDEEAIWRSGKVSGTVYHGGEELTKLTYAFPMCTSRALES
jgi:hypothetical protein